MIRKAKLLAAAVVALSTVASASPAQANHGIGSSPVLGYIQITHIAPATAPSFTPLGVLANAALWNCAGAVNPTDYTVTCTWVGGNPLNLVWHCDVLHADANPLTPTAAVHTEMDCGDGGAPEAQTAYLTGGPQYDWAWALSSMAVTKFICKVDAKKFGVNTAATPNYRAGCGDPGLIKLHEH